MPDNSYNTSNGVVGTEKSPPMQLNKDEALKSLRDASFSALAILVPQCLEILKVTDFGEYTIYVSLACGILLPLANRYFNVIR